MKRYLFFLLFFLFPTLSCEEVKIQNAQVGDFIVYVHKQQMTLLCVREKTDSCLFFEEISAPKQSVHWQTWVDAKAPAHTSWTITQLDLTTKQILSIYSVDTQKMLSISQTPQFLPTLFKLQLHLLKKEDRKYIGPEPMPGEIDRRILWTPKIIFNGKERHPQIKVFRAAWPKDSSELSGKIFDLYFAENEAITYLPYWIEVPAAFGKIKIMAIDSGNNLSTKQQTASVDKQPQISNHSSH